MAKKNQYLAKKAVREGIIISWTKQVCRDALVLMMEDSGADLEQMVQRMAEFDALVEEISYGLSAEAKASHVRRQVDERLEPVCGEYFAPWSTRYEYWNDSGI